MKYKDFPEFEKVVSQEIVVSPVFLDELYEKSKKEKRVQWLERKKGLTKGKSRTKLGWFPPEKRVEVAAAFVAGMTNSSDLETLTKVPAATIRQWKRKEWWADLIANVRLEQDEKFDAKFTKVIDKTLDKIVDSLDNGDLIYYYDKEGTRLERRKPLSAKESNSILNTVLDKRQLLRGLPTSRTEKVSNKETLTQLADEFRKFAGAKTIESQDFKEITDAEDTEVEIEDEYDSIESEFTASEGGEEENRSGELEQGHEGS